MLFNPYALFLRMSQEKNKQRVRALVAQVTPEEVCRAALIAIGVPRDKVDAMKPGPRMNAWVQLAVMENWPIDQIESELARRGMA